MSMNSSSGHLTRHVVMRCAVRDLSANFKMSTVFNCGFARVFLYESRALALQNNPKLEGESVHKYNSRILNERYKLFKNQFAGNPHFEIQEGKWVNHDWCIASIKVVHSIKLTKYTPIVKQHKQVECTIFLQNKIVQLILIAHRDILCTPCSLLTVFFLQNIFVTYDHHIIINK